jgi:signal transduction histidine kinase
VESPSDLRTQTTLVCGALALAIAVSSLLRGKVRSVHLLFAAFAADIGLWYLSQSLFGFFQAPVLERMRVVLAVLLPALACNLFEAMVPDEGHGHGRMGRLSVLLMLPMLALVLSPYLGYAPARVAVFLYVVAVVAAGLWELGQRGLHSRSRATQRRVRFLVVIGALAGTFTVTDFAWVIGYVPAYHPPPVGVLLSVVFLFILAQALRHERLLDLYELLGRSLVAIAVAFVIAGLFYVLVEVVGQFNAMWLNAILVAIVVLVLFDPLRERMEQQIQRFVFRERRKLEAALSRARRRLTHTLEVDDMGEIVMYALERSRAVTDAALYLRAQDGSGFERLAILGDDRAPAHLEVATATPLLDELEHGAVVLEEIARRAEEGRPPERDHVSPEAALAAAEMLGPLKSGVILPIRAEDGELLGLLIVADRRMRDALSPDDVALLENLVAQLGVVVENSRVYEKLKERDRLAVLGQMAAGLAHEIRNPLGAIKGAAQLLADPPPGDDRPDPAAAEFIGIILEEVERLDGVVGSVLDLARQSEGVVTPVDVNAIARRSLQVLSAEWPDESIRFETELADDLPRAAIPAEQLRQVMMNLIRNAVQASKNNGRVVLASRLRLPTASRPARDDPGMVEISVRDDGAGIAPAALEKIFLPFFTTKDDGTGLGLAICQRIVQSAGGRIEVRSREGQGTTFTVVMPPASDTLGTPTPSAALALGPPDAPRPLDHSEAALHDDAAGDDAAEDDAAKGSAVRSTSAGRSGDRKEDASKEASNPPEV